MSKNLEFSTIRQFRQKYPELFGEHTLRLMEKQGAIPGLYVGNRFLINERLFFQNLEKNTMAERATE